MKKILFGLILIALDIALVLIEGFKFFYFPELFEVLFLLLPFCGLAIAAWGFFDKEDK